MQPFIYLFFYLKALLFIIVGHTTHEHPGQVVSLKQLEK